MSCPSYEELVFALVDEAAGATRAREHLQAGYAACQGRADLITSTLAAFRAGPLPEVPARLQARAVALGRRPHAARESTLSGLLDYLGRLVFDSRTVSQAAFALRGETVAQRHLLYRAGPFDVDLALLDNGALVGQVLPDGDEAPPLEDAVCLLYGEGEGLQTLVHGNGDFRFEGVRPGSYDLILEADRVRLYVTDVDLTSEEGD